MLLGSGLLPQLGVSGAAYLLRDEFTTDRAAGSVNGTASEPGPGTRVGVDTESKLSIVGGNLSLTPRSSAAFGDPGLWIGPIDRLPGTLCKAVTTPGAGATQYWVGFDDNAMGTSGSAALLLNSGTFIARSGGVNGPVVGAYTAGAAIDCIVAMRSLGAMYFVNGKLLWISANGNNAALYVVAATWTATATGNRLAAPVAVWLPTPLASDGFAWWGTTDGLGHAEGIAGGVGSGGGSIAWTTHAGTWGVSGGKAQASTLGGGQAVATVNTSTRNIYMRGRLTRSGGNVGMVARRTDANNLLRVYHDGTNCVLQQVVSGTPTTLITAAATYSASAECVIDLDGNAGRLYYNNALVGATGSINAGLTATDHGIYTTDTGNTIDDFVVWAKGSEGQYSVLDNY